MADAMKRQRWGRRLTWAAVILSVGGVAAALIAAVGSGQELWHFGGAFTVLQYALYAAIAGGLIAILAAFVGWRVGPRLILLNLLALVVALGFIVYLGLQLQTARSVPAIHDVTTNLDDSPQFRALSLREDNLETVPDLDRPELAAMPPEERWKAIHREHYGDIATVRVPMEVPETVRRAVELARERGWEVASADPEAGRMEATDTSFFFRFKDDVVLRARPAPGGGGTLVDMRSVSRVGVSDVGVNAKRVRGFLEELQRTATETES